MLLNENLAGDDPLETCRQLVHCQEQELAVIVLRPEPESRNALLISPADYFEAGAMDCIAGSLYEDHVLARIRLALALQRERRLRRRREDAWENELAERKIMEARLKHLVSHDDLTGLANRRRLEQALELAIIRAKNFLRTNALLYVDLDQFKIINDNEGHEAGDRLLVQISNKVRSLVRPEDLVARVGSDEFAILLENRSEEEALAFADQLRREIGDAHFDCGSASYQICMSVGLVINRPEEEVTVSELLARADQSCHLAKKRGRNTVYKYSTDDDGLQTLRSDVLWAPVIRRALADDRFFLVFQPVMDVHENRITHYEVLLRMHGEKGEAYLPSDFIPVAERMGLIHQIDLWVVEKALDFLASLPPDQSHITVGINLSGHVFQDRTLLPLIKQKLEMTWVSASRLTFEITETAAITNFMETRDMVSRLRAMGCRFALDDFGSGFSSFSYIKNYPVDMLKIDGSFIVNVINDPTDELLVKSMIDVAHSLGKKVIAEYVENDEVFQKVVDMGVDYIQGNYIGEPQVALVAEHYQRRAPSAAGDVDVLASIVRPDTEKTGPG